MYFNYRYFYTCLLLITYCVTFAQYTIRGKVTDAQTGEALPYVVIQFKGTNIGAQTDFDGKYIIKAGFLKDSLKATYVGYRSKARVVAQIAEQTINFQMLENSQELGEILVTRGENPAWEILRRIQAKKSKNDKRELSAYEYESYSKVQVDVDNISKKLRKKKLIRKVIAAIDSMKKVTNDEGKPVIPIYISETISKFYFRNNPNLKKENIVANKITGIMDESNGNFLSQITGSSTTDFNFYQNWMRFLGKDFVSPIAESWKDYYEYDLEDSVMIDEDYCYKINVKPKRQADLAFKGTIWVTKNEYALKQTDLTIGKGANINFVEKIKIQQEMARTKAGPWLSKKLRFTVDMAELADSSAGLLVKYYISNKDIVENQPRDVSFFNSGIEINEDASRFKDDYWVTSRHDSLSEVDKRVFAMVDTIKKIPIVKSYIEIVDIVINGYKKLGPIELGNYTQLYSYNDVEGHRFRLGFRTNMQFHTRLQLKGFAAYGTKDKVFKYGLGFDYWFSKKKWFLAGAEHTYDLEQLAIFSNFRAPGTALFYAFSRWGRVSNRSPFYISNTSVYTQMDVVRGITQKIQFNYQVFDAVKNKNGAYDFGYYEQQGDSTIRNVLTNAELVFETRLARGESFLFFDHRRISTGGNKLPAVTLKYQLGLKGIGGSNFDYHKFSLNLYQKITVGKFGQSIYSLTGNYIPSTLPYPLLNIHLGNKSVIYNPVGFNMMNFFEFVSSKSLALNYQHHFNGFFFNRIPLLNKLKWREVISSNLIWGTADHQNFNLIPDKKLPDGTDAYKRFQILNPNTPYAEVGFGIENIFKFIRVEAYRRLTYIDNRTLWGVKVGATISL